MMAFSDLLSEYERLATLMDGPGRAQMFFITRPELMATLHVLRSIEPSADTSLSDDAADGVTVAQVMGRDISALAERLAGAEDRIAEMRARLDKVIAPSRPEQHADHDLDRAADDGMVDRREHDTHSGAALQPGVKDDIGIPDLKRTFETRSIVPVRNAERGDRVLVSGHPHMVDGWYPAASCFTVNSDIQVKVGRTALGADQLTWVSAIFVKEVHRG